MELSKKETGMIKGLGIIFLVLLHLFDTKNYKGDFIPLVFFNGVPLVYYISLLAGSCVALYLFCSGYGLTIINKKRGLKSRDNLKRIFKLLINYWIILIIFVLVGYLIGLGKEYPGDLKKFLLNFLLLSKSYNGAWWFLQTYVILILLSKYIINLVKKSNKTIIVIISATLYLLAFVQSTKVIINVGNNEFFEIILAIIINFFNCQFAFIIGVLFAEKQIISKIRCKLKDKKYTQVACYIGMFFIFTINGVVENYVMDPITAIVVICIFSIMKIPNIVERVLNFLSKHSTNIWLTHMFFYMIFFKEIVYAPKFPMLIFLWLMILCIIASYGINLIYNEVIGVKDSVNRA